MTFDDPRFKSDNIGDMNIVGPGDRRGADMNIRCKKCGQYLTTVKLNQNCTIDMRIECKGCGMIAEALNLWAEVVGKG